jgi:hypothetical protein
MQGLTRTVGAKSFSTNGARSEGTAVKAYGMAQTAFHVAVLAGCAAALSIGVVAGALAPSTARAQLMSVVLPEPEYPVEHVVAGHGRASGRRWAVFLYRHHGRPCVDETLETTGFVLCQRPAPLLLPVTSSGHGARTVSLIAILAKSNVRSVGLRFDHQGRVVRTVKVKLKPVGDAWGAKARIGPSMRFGIELVHGPVCLRQVTGDDLRGRRTYTSQEYGCGP